MTIKIFFFSDLLMSATHKEEVLPKINMTGKSACMFFDWLTSFRSFFHLFIYVYCILTAVLQNCYNFYHYNSVAGQHRTVI